MESISCCPTERDFRHESLFHQDNLEEAQPDDRGSSLFERDPFPPICAFDGMPNMPDLKYSKGQDSNNIFNELSQRGVVHIQSDPGYDTFSEKPAGEQVGVLVF